MTFQAVTGIRIDRYLVYISRGFVFSWWFCCCAVLGTFPCLFREEVLARFCMLRQQAEKESDDPYLSQADFIAPKVRIFLGGTLQQASPNICKVKL